MSINQIRKIVAGLVVLDVIAVYVYSLTIKGHYPPSHPWSGITLVLMAVNLIRESRHGEGLSPVESRFPVWTFAAAAAVSAGLWTVAAMLAR